MTLAAGTFWEINSGASANNVNGGGFNTLNANFLTNLTTDTNTGNTATPVVSSASYNFVAGDINSWVYLSLGTNWYAKTFYKIIAVAANKATLAAAIGQGLTIDTTTNQLVANTAVGVASVGTPTGGTFGVDYSQGITAIVNNKTDFNAIGASSTLTSATANFTPVMVGNIFHQTTTGTGAFGVVGWYEIVSYTNATTVVLDRTPNSGTASVNTTGFVGGAMSMNSTLDDDFCEVWVGSNNIYSNTGFTLGEAINIGSTAPGTTNIAKLKGYQIYRYDNPTASSKPSITVGALTFGIGQWKFVNNFFITGTVSTVFSCTIGNAWTNLKITNTGATAQTAANINAQGLVDNCEIVSQNGTALNLSSDTRVYGSYLHDSNILATTSAADAVLMFNIFEAAITTAFQNASTSNEQYSVVANNTFYGREAKTGTGVSFAVPTTFAMNVVVNNNFYGFTTAVSQATAQKFSNYADYNNYFNNTTDVTLFAKGLHDIAVNPNFTDATQLSGSTATTVGSVLTQSGGDFSTVEDNVDYLHVTSGTGVTTGGSLITSHTSTTLTVNNALGTSSGGNVVWWATTGHNFGVGTNLAAQGFPGTFPASKSIGYLDIGAVQRIEPVAGGGFVFGG